MKTNRKRLRWIGLLFLLFALYPLFVLGYTWIHVFQSDLDGGGNGPLDAYRHTLASAVVSYTLNERAVDLINLLMESGGKASNRMDIHNNLIGARIGLHAKSFTELEPTVRERISDGEIDAEESDRITWLPERSWRNDRFW